MKNTIIKQDKEIGQLREEMDEARFLAKVILSVFTGHKDDILVYSTIRKNGKISE